MARAAGTGKASSLRLSSDAAGTNALPLDGLLHLLRANSEDLEQAADGTFTVYYKPEVGLGWAVGKHAIWSRQLLKFCHVVNW